MDSLTSPRDLRHLVGRVIADGLAGLRSRAGWLTAALLVAASGAQAQVRLSDQPPFTTTTPAGNLALVLSVEYPTAVSVANIAGYTTARPFLGYFDPGKCYRYQYDATDEANRYFFPAATTTNNVCSGMWSGSFLNWATMQTIDPFRKVLTGGHRVVDTPTMTVLEKALASGQGGEGNFPNRTLNAGVGGATPFASWGQFQIQIQGLGNRMRFTATGSLANAPVVYNPGDTDIRQDRTYEVTVRVRVCEPTFPGGVESNCVPYANGYKPEGLMHEYSDRIRFSAFGYLNDSNLNRDGGVLRARQKFVGPTQPRAGLPPVANTAAEWSSTTGQFAVNPDTADATATGVSNSGVINYLNKFGQSGSYKGFDPVGELYYAAIRYFKNQGNVPQWSDLSTAGNAAQRATWIDGFPVITNWDDPIQYSCQRNYILGIGDKNTHADKNVPGPTSNASEPAKPAAVAGDTSVNAVAQTNLVGYKEGWTFNAGDSLNWGGCCSNNGTLMAGLAYDAHVRDIRPDNAAAPQTLGMQTISTYWLDVLEYQTYGSFNQFWLATKYGGFRVPSGYNADSRAALPLASWHSSTRLSPNGQQLPDNYFTATAPEQVEAGLRSAFGSIASDLQAYTTSFSTATPQLGTNVNGDTSVSASYDARNWTGELEANTLVFPQPPDYQPTQTRVWRASEQLAAQIAGAGWDGNRRVISYDGSRGVPFRSTGTPRITDAQLAALDTSFVGGNDSAHYLDYLRGDRSNEIGQPNSGALYRERARMLGDIVDSRVTVVRGPASSYRDNRNPGYESFKRARAGRTPVAYVGANDGMLHAFDATSGSSGGRELFAFVPSALFNGPSSPATPNVDGLAMLGNPNYIHHYYVNATPEVFDIDMNRAGRRLANNENPTPSWSSILIGGLGKGGRSYYAIDVTNPPTSTENEVQLSERVRWEFPNANTPALARSRFGFSYGEPKVTKTAKYGWVVIFTSGYNNADGRGYLFFVDPRDGSLLETVAVGTAGTPAVQAGLAHVQAVTPEFSDNTSTALYAGDLFGNVWRLDVRRATGDYQATDNPRLIARATDVDGVAQPITTRMRVAEHVRSGERYVMFGTGRLLDATDLGDTQFQTFYAIKDGTAPRFFEPENLPNGVSFPITRANLVNNTDLAAGITPSAARPMGWSLELGRNSSGVGWRNTLEADVFVANGEVAFASVVPGGDACSPAGASRIYALDFANGRTVLSRSVVVDNVRTDQAVEFSTSVPGLVTETRFANIRGERRLLTGGSSGGLSNQELRAIAAPGLRRLNWRELPAPQ